MGQLNISEDTVEDDMGLAFIFEDTDIVPEQRSIQHMQIVGFMWSTLSEASKNAWNARMGQLLARRQIEGVRQTVTKEMKVPTSLKYLRGESDEILLKNV